jgi:hypothetical protein
MADIKKMIKQSFKETYKKMFLMNGFLLASFILLGIMISIMNSSFIKSSLGMLIIISFFVLSIVMMICSSIFILHTMYNSIYQKLFTNEGYLTFTLPVSVESLIISRVVCNIVWCIFNVIVILIGYFIVFFIVTVKDFHDVIQIFNGIDFSGFRLIDAIRLIYYSILAILFLATIILMIISGLAFSHSGTLKKGKSALAVFLYILVYNIYSTIIGILNTFLGFGIAIDFNTDKLIFAFGDSFKNYYAINFTFIITAALSLIGFYYLAKFMLKRKIELS